MKSDHPGQRTLPLLISLIRSTCLAALTLILGVLVTACSSAPAGGTNPVAVNDQTAGITTTVTEIQPETTPGIQTAELVATAADVVPTGTSIAPSATAVALETVSPSGTVSATLVLTQTATPQDGTPGDNQVDSQAVNGIPVEQIIVINDRTAANVRLIYNQGQALGRDANAFSKLGDSLIATPNSFTQFDTGDYNLGVYDYLQPAIDFYSGSFERYGVALRPGLHAWVVFDPLWANKDWCEANEDLLSCEIRLNNPSLLLILLGTNDSGNPPGFDYNMRKVIEFTIEQGIIPVIVTKADRFEGPDNVNNDILRQIAADFNVPLWDFDLVAGTLPGRGLTEDQVHLTIFPENDFTLAEAYQTGHGVHNLTGLMPLEAVRQIVVDED